MFKGVTKADLLLVLHEIGEVADANLKVTELKDMLLKSTEYINDKDFVIEYLATTVTQRKNAEEINKLQLQNQSVNQNNSPNVNDISLDKLIKAVQVLAIAAPNKNESWNLFFDSLERAFKYKEVPKEYKSEILLKLIGEKATNVLVYIKEEELSDYNKIKSLILKEYEPSPFICLENFKRAKRLTGETHQQFASRLRSGWLHYCRLREVQDFNSLVDLIISDKIFDTLDADLAAHIAVKQGENWLPPDELSRDCDIYFTAKGRSFDETKSEKRFTYRENNPENNKYIPPHLRKKPIYENKHLLKTRECFICTSDSHIARNCPSKRNKFERNSKCDDYTARKQKTPANANSKDNILVTNVNSKHLQACKQSEKIDLYPLKKITIYVENTAIEAIVDSGTELSIINRSLIPNLKVEPKGKILLESAFKENVQADLVTLLIHYKSPKSNIFASQNVLFALTEKLNVPCLITPDVYNSLMELQNDDMDDNQSCQYVDNPQVVNVLKGESTNNSVIHNFQNEIIIGDNKRELVLDSMMENKQSNQIEYEHGMGHQMVEDKLLDSSNVCFVSRKDKPTNHDEFSESHKFRIAQKECQTLKNSFNDANLGKNNYVIRDELLYHKDTICGDKIYQLVLPLIYRDKILKLAHDSVFGNHLGMRKTRERIKLTFFWPNISKDVENYCRTCKECQLRSRERQTDKIPITPVVRPPYPFYSVAIDIIGEISPPSGRKHKYCLCLIDQNTRWPEVIPLRNLHAKTTCDALLEIFMRTGIPEVICSDQGTNFTSQLTQEFENRLGICPRFSTPAYPASNGLVEKFNSVLKQMLHHVIRTDPVNWDKHIPYLLFAYREVPNCTTGVSPFKLMYGREARGPLSVLKSSWSGEIPLPLNLSNSAIDYLQELKINLEKAADLASLTATEKQASYARYFNRRKTMKEFQNGDLVYLLIPDSTNKLYARWTGPGEIIERVNPHSYKVKLPDGNIKHVHANKIRKFQVRTQTVGVIFEDDVEFGEIHPTPIKESRSKNIIEIDLNHLDDNKQLELRKLLDKHESLFSGKIQIAKVGEHKIRLLPGAERKKPYVYKIPESLKSEVDNQIEELINLDLIEPSEAEIAYPIVCVAKKDGSMRLCIDFRLLNVVTIPFDYPMENASELINEIGSAKLITCLDVLKGYWEIPLEEQSRDLTSFKTHNAQYRWKVMPFGLRNAAATFQKSINNALRDHRKYCKAYLDDIAVFSDDFDTHLKHLDAVLSKLTELKFTVNVKKCVFVKSEIKYLGHIIGSGRHRPDPDKLRAIETLASPKTKTALKSALGLFNYYRDYIKNYAEIAKTLTDLTKKKIPETIPWSEVEENSFQSLKCLLCDAPKLYTPNPKKPYTIQCDASSYGVGACLSQRDQENNLQPISFVSQKFNKVQQNWSTIEREAYAVVWSIKKFESYVFGVEIELITDHNPLIYLQKSAPQSAKLQRWALALQRFNINISHCPGSKLKNADGLSRLIAD